MLTRSITIIYTIQWSSVGGSTRLDEGVVYVIIKRLLRVSNAVPTVNMEKFDRALYSVDSCNMYQYQIEKERK